MKFSLLIGLMFPFVFSAHGQNFDDKGMMDMYRQHLREAEEALGRQDYKKGVALLHEVIEQFTEKAYRITPNYLNTLGETYYNQSRLLALQHKKKAASRAFCEAVECGWNDYARLKSDSCIDAIRNCRRFRKAYHIVRSSKDYLYALQTSGAYIRNREKCTIHFTYMNASDSNLRRVQEHFNLDSIAGNGNELSKIKNLMGWVHHTVRFDGRSENPVSQNAIDMIELCRKENRGVNSRMMVLILNECYLAMGFKSRLVTCLPKEFKGDCNILAIVYSNTLNKWIWMDPAYNVWVTDENGLLLGISEVRDRMIKGLPLMLNEDANLNGRKYTKEEYLYSRLVKNLYCFSSPLNSEYNSETDYEGKIWGPYVGLLPEGYQWGDAYQTDIVTYDDECFWQTPGQ